jgi:hypothetical protein
MRVIAAPDTRLPNDRPSADTLHVMPAKGDVIQLAAVVRMFNVRPNCALPTALTKRYVGLDRSVGIFLRLFRFRLFRFRRISANWITSSKAGIHDLLSLQLRKSWIAAFAGMTR